jgi:hypothetical protein
VRFVVGTARARLIGAEPRTALLTGEMASSPDGARRGAALSASRVGAEGNAGGMSDTGVALFLGSRRARGRRRARHLLTQNLLHAVLLLISLVAVAGLFLTLSADYRRRGS